MTINRPFLKQNFSFIALILLLTVVSAIFYQQPQIAMWLGFGIAGFSAISNDSIQTLGTFLASNSKRPWWILWLFIGTIMLGVFFYGWYFHAGDLSYGRLDSIPQPQNYHFLHLLAPIILLIITRLKMPVSTTFLILSVFSNKSTIESMLLKTFIGYATAFVVAYILWIVVSKLMHSYKLKYPDQNNTPSNYWHALQWITTAFLWTAWLTQDIANVAVFLPRHLDFNQLLGFSGLLFLTMGVIFYLKGGAIQEVVTEKTDITNVKSATLVDFVYAIILFFFKELNHIPMSTTWVFLGLLAGRELALALHPHKEDPNSKKNNYSKSLVLVMKDLTRAGIGLAISIALAVLINLG